MVINELDSTITAYRYDANSGALTPIQVLSSLPEVDRSGRFLYASNRGDDSIAVFAIDSDTGRLRFLQAMPTQGKTPRFMTSTPNGRFMYALNEDSDTIVALSIDSEQGTLKPTGFSIKSGSPVCMIFSHQQHPQT